MEKTKILTERLIIRNYEEKDLNDLYEYFQMKRSCALNLTQQ